MAAGLAKTVGVAVKGVRNVVHDILDPPGRPG